MVRYRLLPSAQGSISSATVMVVPFSIRLLFDQVTQNLDGLQQVRASLVFATERLLGESAIRERESRQRIDRQGSIKVFEALLVLSEAPRTIERAID